MRGRPTPSPYPIVCTAFLKINVCNRVLLGKRALFYVTPDSTDIIFLVQ